jgi:hypothetical protein
MCNAKYALTTCLLALIGAGGCLTDSDDATSESPDVIQRTIVSANADGTYEQIFEQITSAQLETEIKARMALIESTRADPKRVQNIIAFDSACIAADLWLFDATNLGGNQLCVFLRDESSAFLDLGLVCRNPTCTLRWSNAVRSLWAGVSPGNLTACTPTLCFASPFVHFEPFQRFNSVAAGPVGRPLNNIGLFTP